MNNREIVRLLRAISAAYEIKGENQFKVIAYDRAATSIEHSTIELKDLWEKHNLMSVPGIGTGLAEHLDELFRTGKVKHFEKVMAKLPSSMFPLLEIPRIGPKTAYKLVKSLKINNPSQAVSLLREAAEKGKIRDIPGFGEESEKEILHNLKEYNPEIKRMLLPFAWALAQRLIDFMKEEKAVQRIDPLGSLRRRTATVGDLDLAVATEKPQNVLQKFSKFPQAEKVEAIGENTARILLTNGRYVDLKTQIPGKYGALLQHYTGSKLHNIHLRELALKKGLSLSEYGIAKVMKNGVKKEIKDFDAEESFYKFLGMDWIPPEIREDTGEIEASLKHQLPDLITEKDLKGDLHLHSDFEIETSHDTGASSMEEMINKAINLNYEYIGFSEHNPSFSKHTPAQALDLLKRKKEVIEKLNYSYKKCTHNSFLILNGLEIDIREDGSLSCSEEALELLDYAIVSIHSEFRMPEEVMTKRVLSGLSHPKAMILGHPTGRLLERRVGCDLDWEKVFAFCQKNNKFLEINAWPDRLDLPDSLVREAVKKGVKMVIDTDSHHVEQMDLIAYGVSVARRGWAEKRDIVNTMPISTIRGIFRK